MKMFCRLCVWAVSALIVAGMTAWAMLALYYPYIQRGPVRIVLAGLFGLASVCSFALLTNRYRTLICLRLS